MKPIKDVNKLRPEEELEIAENQWNRYERARDNGHEDFIDRALKCEVYYRGDQWAEEDVAALAAEGRPALTINTILPTVNTVLGEQSSRRADVQFKPRKRGDEAVATTLTKLFMQIADNNRLDWVEQQVFSDGVIMDGRGYFDVRLDFSDHVDGEVRITSKNPMDVLLSPDATDYDPKTWPEVFETRWMTLDEIEEMYGKKKSNKLRVVAENGNSYGADSIEYKAKEGSAFGGSMDDESANRGIGQDEYRKVKCLRVIERQHRTLIRSRYFVDEIHGDQRQVPDHWTDGKAKKFAKQFGLGIISKMSKRIRWTVTCDKVVLHDDWSPYEELTIVPFFSYFRRGTPFGMISNLISPQDQLNKISSQELHIVNSTANSGWLVESGSLVGMTPDDLEEHGAETGLVLEFARGTTAPAKIQPNQIPTGLDRIAMKAAENIKQISGISDAMLGQDKASVSGVAIQAKQNRGALMIAVPLDNLRKTRQYLAERVLNLVQRFYTEQRVVQVTVDTSDPTEPREEIILNEVNAAGEIVNDLTIGEYDIVIGTMPARDSFDEVQFAEAINLRNAGVQIPDDAIIMYSHLDKRAELAKRIRVMTGQEPPTPEEAEMIAFQQEMEMKQLELTIAEMEAKVKKTSSEAALNIAKTQDVADVAPQLAMSKLQEEIQIKREELQLRRDLSQLTNDMRTAQSQTQAATTIAKTAMTTAAQKQQKAHAEAQKSKLN
jgi:hypothetical protein